MRVISLGCFFALLCIAFLTLDSAADTTEIQPDLNKKCRKFAAEGHCDVNPIFMKKNCATTYHAWKSQARVTDFYSIVEKDIYDKDFHFSSLRGKNVYMVNVASEDGDSTSNYQILQQLSALRNDMFEIIIFPCNQFGEKEPRSQRDIAFFARKHGFRGVIMSRGDVNGVDTRPSFRYLKANSDNIHIDGNFEGRFLVHSSGRAEALHPSVDVVELVQRLQIGSARARQDYVVEL